jgi:HAD superfamily hydrolase (TIGR01490 family)
VIDPGGGSVHARRVVAAFDFDGTITVRDTLKPFLVHAFGWPRVAATFARLAPLALRVAVGRAGVDDFKVRAIEHLFAGQPCEPLRAQGAAYAQTLGRLFRLAALERIRWHREQGHLLVLVSASVSLYLAHVARALEFDHLTCTRLSPTAPPAAPCFDGGLAGDDCTGDGKARLLQALLGDLARVELYAYGDSAGDRRLLALADHPSFRPFR